MGISHPLRQRSSGRRIALAVAAAAIGVLATVLPAHAQVPNPDVFINQVLAYRNLNETGDLFFLIRYELPIVTPAGADAWCAELEKTDGCSLTPPVPEAPWSLDVGTVTLTAYTAFTTVPVVAQATGAPRIDHSLGGIYFTPGHGIEWDTENGGSDVQVCVDPSVTLYVPATAACAPPSWQAGATTTAARAQLETDILGVVLNIQIERLYQFGVLVNSKNLLTSEGGKLATEALGFMDSLVPNAFQTSTGSTVNAGYTPVAGDSALQQALDAAAAGSGVLDSLDVVASAWFGMNGSTLATFAYMLFGVALSGYMWTQTKSKELTSMAFLAPFTFGMFHRAPTIAVMFTLVAVMVPLTVAWIVRKLPN